MATLTAHPPNHALRPRTFALWGVALPALAALILAQLALQGVAYLPAWPLALILILWGTAGFRRPAPAYRGLHR